MARMMAWSTLFMLLVVACLLKSCSSRYMSTSGNEDPNEGVVLCPVECVCSTDNETAECEFTFTEFSLYKVMPWQLTKLIIHGNDKTWKSEWASSSVKNVIQTGLQNKKNVKKILETTLSKLRHLDISYIPIYAVANTDLSIHFESLTYLKLAYNNISNVQPKAFASLPELHTLNLDGNKISKLENNLFVKQKLLKKLELGSNSLTVIRTKQLVGLESLEHLNLQSNMLQQLETFLPAVNLSALEMLNVRDNKILYILNETVERISTLQSVDLSSNPFECTCSTKSLINSIRENPAVFKGDTKCGIQSAFAGYNIGELDVDKLPCEGAKILTISPDIDALYQADVKLDCGISGTTPVALYWLTPWGEVFSRQPNKLLFPDTYKDFKSDESYYATNLYLTSRIHVDGNGSLVIDKFRGIFAGKFTCFAKSLIESSNSSVIVDIQSMLHEHYLTSLIYAAALSSGMILVAIIVGVTRIIGNRCLNSKCNCCCCEEEEDTSMEVVHKMVASNGNVAVTYAASDIDTIEYLEDESFLVPPDPPVNSPMYSMSPEKCNTPDEELLDPSKETNQRIWEELEEVRARLRTGAGRKMKQVKSHVRSITDTGNLH